MLHATTLIVSLILFSAVVVALLVVRPGHHGDAGRQNPRFCSDVLFANLLRSTWRVQRNGACQNHRLLFVLSHYGSVWQEPSCR